MRCMECRMAQLETVTAPVRIEMPFVGMVETEAVEHERCPECGDTMLPPEASQEVDRAYQARLDELLGSFPVSDFVSADEAAKIVGKSRQALHQSFKDDGRVRLGFIFRVRKGRAWLYLRQSVGQYAETGDGRFDLPHLENGRLNGGKSAEEARVVVTTDHARRLVDAISRQIENSELPKEPVAAEADAEAKQAPAQKGQ